MLIASSPEEGKYKIYLHNKAFKCSAKSFECSDLQISNDIKSYIKSNHNDVKHSIFYITEPSPSGEDLVAYMSCRLISLKSSQSSCNPNNCHEECIPFLEVMVLARDKNSNGKKYGEILMAFAEEYVKYINLNFCESLNTIVLEPLNDSVKDKFYIGKMNYIDNFCDIINVFGHTDRYNDYLETFIYKPIAIEGTSFFDSKINEKVTSLLSQINSPCGKTF